MKFVPLFVVVALCLSPFSKDVFADDLVIAQNQKTTAIIISSPDAIPVQPEPVLVRGRPAKQRPVPVPNERQAALDLQKYIEMMTGAKPQLADSREAIDAALKSGGPLLIIGAEAIKAEPSLQAVLDKTKKQNAVLRADAIAVRRAKNRVYITGNNDESIYHAVSYLLQQWGCRWYLPTDIGEVIPTVASLKLGEIDYAYAPPFEVRHYWIAWNGSNIGASEFRIRNYMSSQRVAGMGHALASYTKDIAPEGKSHYAVPFSDPATAAHVASKIEEQYAAGAHSISLAMEDGAYENDSKLDAELQAGIKDKYFYDKLAERDSLTDPMMVFYNNVAKILREKYPESKTRIGGMAYINVTIPPQREFKPEPSLVMWLAPIDIDPNHGMDDPNSPPRQEYKEMVYRWADIMEGRVVIYDYDQGNLVWRDLPNPSHFAFAQDVKHYRNAKILGIGTESRNAIATTFLNLYFRGQLMWNPDADVKAMLAEFYTLFYGPAAKPMGDFWNAIFDACEKSIVTEHEHFLIPAIYTPELIAKLKVSIDEAQALVKPLASKGEAATRSEKQYVERAQFAQLTFNLIDSHHNMITAAGTEAEYPKAAELGAKAFEVLMDLTRMNPTFTTGFNPPPAGTPATGFGGNAAWWAGEIKQYQDLATLTAGPFGKLVAKTPLEWAFHRDPNDTGMVSGWAYKPVDLTYWEANSKNLTVENRKDYPTTQWEKIRTDLYPQGQGIRHPDLQSFTGHIWYRTDLELTADQVEGSVHLMMPGAFNTAWLYVNGNLVNYRPVHPMWWYNNYKCEWDVSLAGVLKPGKNTIALRFHNPHHFGGLFRRPFLYRADDAAIKAAADAAKAAKEQKAAEAAAAKAEKERKAAEAAAAKEQKAKDAAAKPAPKKK